MVTIVFDIHHIAHLVLALITGPAILLVAYNVLRWRVDHNRKALRYNIEENQRLRNMVKELGGDPRMKR